MEENNTSSNNPVMGHHYANLLSTVSDLRSELERAISKISSMEEQNINLKSNNKQLTELLKETRKKYNEAQENYMNTVGLKFEQERQHEAFLEQVKRELAEKTKEFEEQKEQFVTQDIEYIRLKVSEELEYPHKNKILLMENEVEKYKEIAFNTQRDLERCKADFETHSSLQTQAATSALEEHEASINELQSYVARLKDRNFNAEKDDKIRTQRIQIGELEQTVISLRTEISSVRSEKDEILYNFEQNRSRNIEEVTALRANITSYESSKLAAEKKASLLLTELEEKDVELRVTKQNASELSHQIDSLRMDLADTQAAVVRAKEDGDAAASGQRSLFDADRTRQTSLIETLQGKLSDREDRLRRAQRELVEVQARAENTESVTRKIYASELTESKQKIDALILEKADLHERLGNEISTLMRTVDMKNSELETLKIDYDRIRREKGVLHDKLQNLETKIVGDRSKAALTRRDLSTKLAVIEERETRLRSDLSKANISYEEAKAHDEEQMKEIRRLQSRLNKLEMDAENRVQTTTAAMKEQQENIERICLLKLEEGKRVAKDQIAKEKRKADAYREKALESHARNKALLSRYAPDFEVTGGLR